MEVSTGAAAVSTGASFTAVTLIDAVSVAVENGLVPPGLEASTFAPALPAVWSQAR